MIFCGGPIFFCALIFALQVSTLNAYYLNNNGYESGYDGAFKDDKECNGCVGYKCKLNDGKIIEGKDCLKNVVKFCGLSKSDVSMLKTIVQEKVYEYKTKTLFISSCQDNKYMNDAMGEEDDYMDGEAEKTRERLVDEKMKEGQRAFDVAIKSLNEIQKLITNIYEKTKKGLYSIGDAKKAANNITKDGELMKQKADEINEKIIDAKDIFRAYRGVLNYRYKQSENERKLAALHSAARKSVEFSKNAEFEHNFKRLEADMISYSKELEKQKEEIFEKAEELKEQINEAQKEADKILQAALFKKSADNAFESAKESLKTAEEAKEASVNATKVGEEAREVAKESKEVGIKAKKDAKRVGESAKKEAKESKEIGENSNKTANLAVEIGMEAKMAANESMKIGNEANQKILEVEKLAKDSMKLAEKNKNEGDKTVAEVQKLKSNGEKNGCKFGIFAIVIFACIFLY